MGSGKKRRKVFIEFTPYMRKRMRRRGVNENQVREAVLHPTRILSSRPNQKTGTPRRKHYKRLGGKSIWVVVEYMSEEHWVAVTTYWESR